MIRRLLRHRHKLLDGRFWRFMAQRQVMNPKLRERLADRIARSLPTTANLDQSAMSVAAASALVHDGVWHLGVVLDDHKICEIVTHLSAHTCQDPYRPELGRFDTPETAPAISHVAFYAPEAVLASPHVLELANNPSILAIVEQALGCKPTIAYIASWWSLKGHDRGEQAELFHRDVDDWRFFKLFVYLTDVDIGAGPHVYVPGSHGVNKLTRIGRFSDEAVAAAFGAGAIHRYEGPRGTAFLENTFGLHRGSPADTANRLILQVVYSLGPLPYGPKQPLDPDAIAAGRSSGGVVDPYINRIYLRAR